MRAIMFFSCFVSTLWKTKMCRRTRNRRFHTDGESNRRVTDRLLELNHDRHQVRHRSHISNSNCCFLFHVWQVVASANTGFLTGSGLLKTFYEQVWKPENGNISGCSLLVHGPTWTGEDGELISRCNSTWAHAEVVKLPQREKNWSFVLIKKQGAHFPTKEEPETAVQVNYLNFL